MTQLLEQYGLSIIHGANEVEEVVAAIARIDDPGCDAVREALPHLKEAAALLEPLVAEHTRAKGQERRRTRARASDRPERVRL